MMLSKLFNLSHLHTVNVSISVAFGHQLDSSIFQSRREEVWRGNFLHFGMDFGWCIGLTMQTLCPRSHTPCHTPCLFSWWFWDFHVHQGDRFHDQCRPGLLLGYPGLYGHWPVAMPRFYLGRGWWYQGLIVYPICLSKFGLSKVICSFLEACW